ncbi:MAG TPA: exosortase/archaeosortase family protein [Bryobacteraceae bacterium]|jgi:exosortase|nr:exosortase/archaeosortase family protein [Bryobacteraceae bacterium]
MFKKSQKRWLLIATCAALLVCYRHVIAGMIDQWSNDEDMGHAFLVPVVIGFIIWREREQWGRVPIQPSAWGLVLLMLGVCLQVIGAIGAGLFAGSAALLCSVAGIVMCLGGVPLLKCWRFPLLLTLFMLPKLAILYNQLTLPLQLLASRMAAGMLMVSGAAVLRAGNILDVNGHQIAIAEACNGIRYLLPLGFTSLVFAYLADARPWMRIALLLWAIPVAIIANAVRVAVSAYSPNLAEGRPHMLLGAAIFIACVATFPSVRALWDKLAGSVAHA